MDEIVPDPRHEVDIDRYAGILAGYENPKTSFHPIGIHDAESLYDISQKKSCYVENQIPLWVGSEDMESLVDEERCKQIIGYLGVNKDQVTQINLALVPLRHLVGNKSYKDKIDENTWVIAEYEDDGHYEEVVQSANDRGFHVEKLIHPSTHTEASLQLFEFTALAHKNDLEATTLNEALAQGRVASSEETSDGGSLRIKQGGSFSDDEQGQLWDLFSTRFQDISQNMPMKLEEDEESTRQLLQDPNFTFVYKVEPDGNIACCVFATDQRGAYPWISTSFTERVNEEDEEKYGKPPYGVFVPGVAAYEQQGVKASTPVLQRFADLIASTNQELFAIRAECTDVSALYIPDIVMKNIETNPNYKNADLQKLGEKKIVFLHG